MDNWRAVCCAAAQAINSCLHSDAVAADSQLTALGCRWRLASGVWKAAAPEAASSSLTSVHVPVQRSEQTLAASNEDGTMEVAVQGEGMAIADKSHTACKQQEQQWQQKRQQPSVSPVLVHDALLPPHLLVALQAAFHPTNSDFWRMHSYGEDDTPFFSYLIDLHAAAVVAAQEEEAVDSQPVAMSTGDQHHTAIDALTATALHVQARFKELAATIAATAATTVADWEQQQQLLHPAAVAAVSAAASASHVEWWVHCRPPGPPTNCTLTQQKPLSGWAYSTSGKTTRGQQWPPQIGIQNRMPANIYVPLTAPTAAAAAACCPGHL